MTFSIIFPKENIGASLTWTSVICNRLFKWLLFPFLVLWMQPSRYLCFRRSTNHRLSLTFISLHIWTSIILERTSSTNQRGREEVQLRQLSKGTSGCPQRESHLVINFIWHSSLRIITIELSVMYLASWQHLN